jgi:hypothetical protein
MDDIPPTYPMSPNDTVQPTFSTPISLPPTCVQIIALCRNFLTQRAEIIDILEDIAKLTVYLQSKSTCTTDLVYTEATLCVSYLNAFLHRLLGLIKATPTPPYSLSRDGAVEESCRLASILYLAELRRNFGIRPVLSQVQLSKLRSLLENDNYEENWEELGVIRMWILAVAIVEEQEEEPKMWYLERLKRVARVNGLRSMIEVRDTLTGFLWMDLHDKKFSLFVHE